MGSLNESNAPRGYRGKVLVTGASGHLGANLVRRLVADGRDVRALLRSSTDPWLQSPEATQVEKVFGDLRDAATVTKAVRGCETIFHSAANVSTLQGNAAHKQEIYTCNVLGTRNVLHAAKDTGVSRVVITGSFSAIGYDPANPSKPMDESAPFYPFTRHLPYAYTKLLAEHEGLKAAAEGLDVVLCTSTAILGPRDYKPSRMGKLLIDFTHRRLRAYIPGGFEFVAARDIVQGHMLAMEKGRKAQRYIISSRFMTVDAIMEIFEEVTKKPRPRLKLSPLLMQGIAYGSSFVANTFFPRTNQRFTVDAVRILRMQRHAITDKACNELGYEPTSIRDAIAEAYDDFAARGLVPPSSITKQTASKTHEGRLETTASAEL